jgi:uncharacterized protein YyaL (SSP411 family)
MMAAALATYVAGVQQIVIVGANGRDHLEHAIGTRYRPFAITLALDDNQQRAVSGLAPWIGAMAPVENKATAFVCQHFACEKPVTSAQALLEALELPGFGARESGSGTGPKPEA